MTEANTPNALPGQRGWNMATSLFFRSGGLITIVTYFGCVHILHFDSGAALPCMTVVGIIHCIASMNFMSRKRMMAKNSLS